MNETRFLAQIKRERRKKLFFYITTLLGVVGVVFYVNNLLVSIVIALIIFFMVAPVVEFLERKGLSRALSATIPFIGISILFFILADMFLPTLVTQFQGLKNESPRYIQQANQIVNNIQVKISDFIPESSAQDLTRNIQSKVILSAQEIFKNLPSIISNSLTILFLVPFITFFMLLDGRSILRQLFSLVPNDYFEMTLNLHHQVMTQIGGFIRARFVESFLVGLMIWIGLLVIGFPYALLLAFFAALLNPIPYLGPVIAVLPPMLIALSNQASADTIFWVAMIYLIAQVIDTVLIVPFLVAKIVNLHAITVIIAVMIGSQLLGILGMIVSIPVASAFKVIFSSLYEHLTRFKD